jgi:hypothetical protein
VKSCFPFFLFQISFIYFSIFYFTKCKGEQKQICSGKGEKKMVDLGVREKIQIQMVEEGWKKIGITIGLPPGESFTFIVSEQDRLHTFEE